MSARTLLDKGTGPYFYLPKLESHLEARLWNDVFILAQQLLGVPRGTIKATVLIETILATFEMDEILYELREHSSCLNCGHWDYIFSAIKKFRNHPEFIYPDRAQVTMTTHMRGSRAGHRCRHLPKHRNASQTILSCFKSSDRNGDSLPGNTVRQIIRECRIVAEARLYPFPQTKFTVELPKPSKKSSGLCCRDRERLERDKIIKNALDSARKNDYTLKCGKLLSDE